MRAASSTPKRGNIYSIEMLQDRYQSRVYSTSRDHSYLKLQEGNTRWRHPSLAFSPPSLSPLYMRELDTSKTKCYGNTNCKIPPTSMLRVCIKLRLLCMLAVTTGIVLQFAILNWKSHLGLMGVLQQFYYIEKWTFNGQFSQFKSMEA